MSLPTLAQYGLFLVVVTLLVKPLGGYMTRVFTGQKTLLDPLFVPVEHAIYRLTGVDAKRQMDAQHYTVAFVVFSLVGTLLLYAILRLQAFLPWYDPAHLTTPMTSDLAMNTALSFSTTTTWQAYAGETTMSYFSQIVGLAVQNFLAGAAGLAIGIAFMRGFAREHTTSLGNFWVDLIRALLWVLLPASVLVSIVLIWQGVPMNFSPYIHATTIEGGSQTIAQGPVAALERIKNLGTNGGGFFNVNGAHPYENPTPLANLIEMLSIVVIPAALTNTFGRMVGSPRQGWLLFWVMAFLFVVGLRLLGWAEQSGNPTLAPYVATGQPMGNMEGKEVRFGARCGVERSVWQGNKGKGYTRHGATYCCHECAEGFECSCL